MVNCVITNAQKYTRFSGLRTGMCHGIRLSKVLNPLERILFAPFGIKL